MGRKEKKGRVFDVLGILLAFLAAAGGLFLAKKALDQNRETLLSKTGQVKTVLLSDGQEGKEREEAINELADVVKTWENEQVEYPHEPGNGQLSMEEAVEISQNWVKNFYKKYRKQQLKGIQDLTKYSKVSANLCMKQKEPSKEDTFVVMYSYWKVAVVDEITRAEFILNAATGQILDVFMFSYYTGMNFLDISQKKVLHEYVRTFDPEKKKRVKKDGVFRYEVLKKGKLYALLRVSNSLPNWEENGYEYGNYFHLSLSTFLPSEKGIKKEKVTVSESVQDQGILVDKSVPGKGISVEGGKVVQ